MITLIASATSQTQAASALTDLRNRGYDAEVALVKSGEPYDDDYAGYVSRTFNHGHYIVSIRCEPDEAGHIKEHLGELHGLDRIKIVSEND